MISQQSRHVFISYVREDKETVDKLCQEFDKHGVNYWIDRNDIMPGARWKDAIREAIQHGGYFVACFSEEYTIRTKIKREKTYMNEELLLAIEELRKYGFDREWFIPVLLSECDVPARSIGPGETLLDINFVPLYEDWDNGIQRILSVIKPIPKRVQNLISALMDDENEVRSAAAYALGEIGHDAWAAEPAFIEALKSKDKNVCLAAALNLGKIGPDADAAVTALTEALKHNERDVRIAAALSLSDIGPDAVAAIPSLIEALKDKVNLVRSMAARALGEIGFGGRGVVQALIEALEDDEDIVQSSAKEALNIIKNQTESK